MNLTFFLDEPNVRAALAVFAQSATDVMLVSSEGTRRWDGELPTRAGDYFYDSPWVLYSSSKKATPVIDLSTFSADHFKNPEQVVNAFQSIAHSVDWSVFSWGGYARYGMLGLVASEAVKIGVEPVFHYKSADSFGNSFKVSSDDVPRRNSPHPYGVQ